MRHVFLNSAVCVLILFIAVGCHRTPTKLEITRKEVQLLLRYSTEDAKGAKAAMLELEAYLRAAEKAGNHDSGLAGGIAAVYSRLYLLETQMGRDEVAGRYYGMASNYWCRSALRQGKRATADEISHSINGVDGYVGVPRWRRQ